MPTHPAATSPVTGCLRKICLLRGTAKQSSRNNPEATPLEPTSGAVNSGAAAGGGHTAAAGQRGSGATYCSGGGKRGWDPKRGHPSGTHNRKRQRRMAPTNRNSHQVATADWGPRKKGPYNSVHRGHPLGRADTQRGTHGHNRGVATRCDAHLGTVNWGSNPKGLYNRDSQPGTQLVGTQLVGTQIGGIHIRPGPSIRDTHPPAEAWLPNTDSDAQTGPSIGGHQTATGAIHRGHPPGPSTGAIHRGQPAGTHGGLPFSEPSDRGSQRAQLVGTHILNGAAAGPPIAAGAASGADPKRGHPSGTSIGDSHRGQPSGTASRGHTAGTSEWKQLLGPLKRDSKCGHTFRTRGGATQQGQPRDRNPVAAQTGTPNGDIQRGQSAGTHCGLPVLGAIQPGTQFVGTHIRAGAIHRGHTAGCQFSEPSDRGSQRGHPSGCSSWGHTMGTHDMDRQSWLQLVGIHIPTGANHRGHPSGPSNRSHPSEPSIGAIRRDTHMATHNPGLPTQSPPPRRRDPTTQSDSR